MFLQNALKSSFWPKKHFVLKKHVSCAYLKVHLLLFQTKKVLLSYIYRVKLNLASVSLKSLNYTFAH